MTKSRAAAGAALMLAPLMMGAAAQTGVPAGTLHVQVGNVRGAHGSVHIEVCTQGMFLKDCPMTADSPAKIGVTTVTLAGLPPGHYAVQAYYDENGNGKIDRALFGVPKEGVGFSNDARIGFGPPKWSDAVFVASGGEQTIRLKLRYFFGSDAKR